MLTEKIPRVTKLSQTATYTLTDNTTKQVADAKFVVDNLYSQGTDIEELTPEIEALPDAKGYGNIYVLRQAIHFLNILNITA